MRIRPGTQVTVSEQGSIFIDSGPDRRELKGLTSAQIRDVEHLVRGNLMGVATPGTVRVSQRRKLLEALRPWLEDVDPAYLMPGLAAERLRPDARAWSGVWKEAGEGAKGSELMLARTTARVWISRLDRAGLALGMLLASAGVGRIAAPSEGVVEGEDLGSSPLRLTELGLPRPLGLARHLTRLYPHAHVLAPVEAKEAMRGADVCVVIARNGVDPGEVKACEDAQVPVLPVIFRPGGYQIGPLLLPGASCPRCVLSAWPQVGRQGREIGGSAPAELSTLAVATGLVAQATLMLLDGVVEPEIVGGAWMGTLGTGAVVFNANPTWCPHERAA